MAFKTISEFVKSNKYEASLFKYGTIFYIKEAMGPEDYERFCHFAYINDEYIQTAPHIDVFNVEGENRKRIENINTNNDIIISGDTIDIEADFYDDDDYTLSQYFLENPTRKNSIQYLIQYDLGGDSDEYTFKAFVPGLICSDSGEALGYIHSYVTSYNRKVTLEIPWDKSTEYNLIVSESEASFTRSGNSLIITLKENIIKTDVELVHGNSSKIFTIFSNNYPTSKKSYKIKIVNEYGDYAVAAQLTNGSINEILNLLSEIEEKKEKYLLPKTFKSLALKTFSETVKNISLDIYKVPVALVLKGENRFFMIDVAGISANKIENRN